MINKIRNNAHFLIAIICVILNIKVTGLPKVNDYKAKNHNYYMLFKKKKPIEKVKSELKKLRKHNQAFHNIVPDYAWKKESVRLERVLKLRNAYFKKLAKMPFFKDLLKNKKKLNFRVNYQNKEYIFDVLRTGISNKRGGRKTLIVFDLYGRGQIFTKINTTAGMLWYPTNILIKHEGNKRTVKTSPKSFVDNEHLAIKTLSDELERRMDQISFIKFEETTADRKIIQAIKYI